MVSGVDEVFRALADPTRRSVLDALFIEDGQTLSQLSARFDMSRYGVMKHLGVLEEAGLLVGEKEGRNRFYKVNHERLEIVRSWLGWFFEHDPKKT